MSDEDDEDFVEVDPAPEDLDEAARSHYGPHGPVQPVWAWAQAIGAGDYQAAWAWCDDNLRLARAQAWVFNNSEFPDVAAYDRDELAASLAAGDVSHELWEAFAETEVAQMRAAFSDFDEYGAASGTRLVGVGLEVVVFVKTGADVVQYQREAVVSQPIQFLMRSTGAGGWLLAGHGVTEPVPGWPPSLVREP